MVDYDSKMLLIWLNSSFKRLNGSSKRLNGSSKILLSG